jgi:hypothetical protein
MKISAQEKSLGPKTLAPAMAEGRCQNKDNQINNAVIKMAERQRPVPGFFFMGSPLCGMKFYYHNV